MKRSCIIVLMMIIVGCNSEGDIQSNLEANQNYNIEKYFFYYMDSPEGTLIDPSSDNLVKLEYNNDLKIIKRNGSFAKLDPSSGFNYLFVSNIYDQLTYTGNEILIEQKSTLINFTLAKFERKLILDNNNRIIKKTIYKEFAVQSKDTIIFSYDSSGKLSETIKGKLNGNNEKAKFYYDQINNLDSIVTKKYNQINLESKTVEIFSNYDTSSNPLKNLIIFEETFNRSLSKNNYKKYEIKIYDQANEIVYTSFRIWVLKYDSNGNVKF